MNPYDRYDSLFVFYAQGPKIDWLLLKAQVRQESAFKPSAVSRVGAKGLAQFMDATWKGYSTGDPFNPEHAIDAQSLYMGRLLAMFDGNVELALASYNWGEGRVKARLLKHNASTWEQIEKFAPQETKDYVQKILHYYAEYRREQETPS